MLKKVILGGLLGIFTGLIFGEYAANLNPIGLIYIRLMEAAVYPYIISSLLLGLGQLTPSLSYKLFTHGWKSYLLLISLCFISLVILTDAIPYASTITHTPFDVEKLLSLLIPANLFQALTANYVPAVILFCVLFGIALQRVEKKKSLLSLLDVISRVCLTFWQHLVRFSPLAIFALLANTVGTLNWHEFKELYVYLLLFFIGTLSLTFWFLPALASSLTPLSMREVIKKNKRALLISLSTTLSAAAIPFIQRMVEQSLKEAKAKHADKKEIVDTCVLVSYPFTQIGNTFIYLFIFFSAFYYNHAISDKNPFLVALVSYFASIGTGTSTINSLGFLSEWLALPSSTTQFYVSLLPLIRYGLVITSVMGLSFFTLITAYAYFGLLRVRWTQLCFHLATAILFFSLISHLAKPLFPDPGLKVSERFEQFELSEPLVKHASMRINPNQHLHLNGHEDALNRIKRRKVLRIGFSPTAKPFSYYNHSGHLVGFDVSYAYALADSLHVAIEFVPFQWGKVMKLLNAGDIDMAISGIYVTSDRLTEVNFTEPYLRCAPAIITTKSKEKFFNSTKEINDRHLKIAVFHDSLFDGLSEQYFHKEDLIQLNQFNENYIEKLKGHGVDGILWNEIQANLWANTSPTYISSTPEDLNAHLLFAFMIGRQSPEFLTYVNYWLKMKKEDGFFDANYAQWIKGTPPTHLSKRKLFDVVKNRLHLA